MSTIGAYIGVNNKAKKIKDIYIGVDGVAKKVIKAYIGDENGHARLWWDGGEGNWKVTHRIDSIIDSNFPNYLSINKNYVEFNDNNNNIRKIRASSSGENEIYGYWMNVMTRSATSETSNVGTGIIIPSSIKIYPILISLSSFSYYDENGYMRTASHESATKISNFSYYYGNGRYYSQISSINPKEMHNFTINTDNDIWDLTDKIAYYILTGEVTEA